LPASTEPGQQVYVMVAVYELTHWLPLSVPVAQEYVEVAGTVDCPMQLVPDKVAPLGQVYVSAAGSDVLLMQSVPDSVPLGHE